MASSAAASALSASAAFTLQRLHCSKRETLGTKSQFEVC